MTYDNWKATEPEPQDGRRKCEWCDELSADSCQTPAEAFWCGNTHFETEDEATALNPTDTTAIKPRMRNMRYEQDQWAEEIERTIAEIKRGGYKATLMDNESE